MVDTLMEMQAFEWLGENLNGKYLYDYARSYVWAVYSYTLIVIII